MSDNKSLRRYRCYLTPMGEYFFGNEQRFDGIDGKESEGKSRYMICSNEIPGQSTLLGIIRYLVLEQNTALWGQEREKESAALVGKMGFSYDEWKSESTKDYGIIDSIGALVIVETKKEDELIIPMPLDQTHDKNAYCPFALEGPFVTERKLRTYLPCSSYDAKEGLSYDYLRLTASGTGESISKSTIFSTKVHTRVGISNAVEKRNYFKKEYVSMREGYRFAFDVTIDMSRCESLCPNGPLPDNAVVFAGQEKSTFFFACEEMQDSLETRVREVIRKSRNEWMNPIESKKTCKFYLLSDAMIPDTEQAVFAVTEAHYERTLTYGSDSRKKNRSRLMGLYRRGSVFLVDSDACMAFAEQLNQAALRQIGLNRYILLEG